ncbi:hypothetical protein MASR1M90_17440 [Desulfovibrionales bacterium]
MSASYFKKGMAQARKPGLNARGAKKAWSLLPLYAFHHNKEFVCVSLSPRTAKTSTA